MKARNSSNITGPTTVANESSILRRGVRGSTILGMLIVVMVAGSWGYDACASAAGTGEP